MIDCNNWKLPEIFSWLKDKGNVKSQEMYRTFNCGIGMIVCVAKENVTQALELLSTDNAQAFVVGSIDILKNNEEQVEFLNIR